MSVRIGIAPGNWQWRGGGAAYLRFVDACESNGWDSLWLSDRLVGERMSLEPVTALAVAAGRTTDLKFGTSVLALAIRNPALLAKEVATVDFLSGGRFLPAVGLGGDDEREYEATGGRKSERAGRTDEAIEVLRRLWTEEHVTHHGKYYHLTDVTITPKPVFTPYPPIWIGGRTAFAWERVARSGDGWLASQVTPADVTAGIAAIRQGCEQSGRTIEDDHFGVMLSTYLTDSKTEAAERLAAGSLRPRPDAPLEQYSAAGDAALIQERIAQYVQAGATKFVLRLLCREDEAEQQLELMAKQVLSTIA